VWGQKLLSAARLPELRRLHRVFRRQGLQEVQQLDSPAVRPDFRSNRPACIALIREQGYPVFCRRHGGEEKAEPAALVLRGPPGEWIVESRIRGQEVAVKELHRRRGCACYECTYETELDTWGATCPHSICFSPCTTG